MAISQQIIVSTVKIILLVLLFMQAVTDARAWQTARITPNPVVDFPKGCIIWNGHLENERRLLVSNSPESVTHLDTPVLWHDEVIGKSGKVFTQHRIFLWHANGLASTGIKVGVTVENLSPDHSLTLTGGRVVAAVGRHADPIKGVGLPIAVGALDIDNAQGIPLADPTVAPATSLTAPAIRGVIGWNLYPGQMVGAIIELTVMKSIPSAPGDLHYMVRVVAGRWGEQMTGNSRLSEGGNGSGLSAMQVKVSHAGELMTHSRGSWAHCDIAIDNRTHPFSYSLNPRFAFITFPGANDLLMTRANSYDSQHASIDGNAGNWGVMYRITVYVTLPANTSRGKRIEMRFVAVNTWSKSSGQVNPYAGAARVNGGAVNTIPVLKWGTKRNSTGVIWTFTPLPGNISSQTIQLVHAGGACLPVAIMLKGI